VVPLSAHPFLLSCGAAVSKNLGCGEADWVETALSSGGVSRTASMFGAALYVLRHHMRVPAHGMGRPASAGLARNCFGHGLCCDRFLQESLESGRWALGA
jgi:hypothetical protein